MSRTIDAPITEPGGPKDTLKPRVYGFSVLVTGFARLFKQPLAFALVIVANAAVQGLLTHWTILTTDTPEFYFSAILSGISLLVCFAFICRLALATVDGKITLAQMARSTTNRAGLFLLWVLAELAAIWVLTVLFFWPGLIFMLVIPFVALAAMDGRRNALGTNFRAIRERFGRYLVTMVFWIVSMLASDVLIGLGSITLSPTVVAVIGWVYKGLVGAWLTCAFAALYRSTTTGAATTTSADATTP